MRAGWLDGITALIARSVRRVADDRPFPAAKGLDFPGADSLPISTGVITSRQSEQARNSIPFFPE